MHSELLVAQTGPLSTARERTAFCLAAEVLVLHTNSRACVKQTLIDPLGRVL